MWEDVCIRVDTMIAAKISAKQLNISLDSLCSVFASFYSFFFLLFKKLDKHDLMNGKLIREKGTPCLVKMKIANAFKCECVYFTGSHRKFVMNHLVVQNFWRGVVKQIVLFLKTISLNQQKCHLFHMLYLLCER